MEGQHSTQQASGRKRQRCAVLLSVLSVYCMKNLSAEKQLLEAGRFLVPPGQLFAAP